MIQGMGLDLCQVRRIEQSLQREHFFRRVFGREEQAWLESLPPARRAQSAAGNFAAKEAFLKAAGSGLGRFALAQIQCLRQESGAPRLVLSGPAGEYMAQNHLQALVTITHEGGMAAALVVLEAKEIPSDHD